MGQARSIRFIRLPVNDLRRAFLAFLDGAQYNRVTSNRLWREFYRSIRDSASITVKKAK